MESVGMTLSANISSSVDNKMRNMERTSFILMSNEEVRKVFMLLQDGDASFFDVQDALQTLAKFSFTVITTRDFFEIDCYGKDGTLLYCTGDLQGAIPVNLFDNPMVLSQKELLDARKKSIFSPTETVPPTKYMKNPVSILRPMVNPQNDEIIGYVSVVTELGNTITSFNEQNSANHNLVPFNLRIIDTEGNSFLFDKNLDLQNFDEFESFFTQSEYTSWSIGVDIPRKYFYKISFQPKLKGLVIPILCILFCTFLLLRLLKKNLSSFALLYEKMKKVSAGDFSVTIDEESDSIDVEQVYLGFNIMTSEIDKLVNQKYANEILFRSVQLEMLKLQINPHFLFNTLQTLEAIGEINRVPEVQEISFLLGDILRYNLKERDMVTVEEEMKSVTNFLRIEKIRFQEKLNYSFCVEGETKLCYIPKFIIQPIIENSISHGFSNCGRSGILIVQAFFRGDRLVIAVRDNGKGFTGESLEALQKTLRDSNKEDFLKKDFIGLKNVHRRIITRFGSGYGLHISSEKNQFTSILLVLPILLEA
jgi:two-component system sensor histidine kinase YesM